MKESAAAIEQAIILYSLADRNSYTANVAGPLLVDAITAFNYGNYNAAFYLARSSLFYSAITISTS